MITTLYLSFLNVVINCYELNRKICFTRIRLGFVYAQLQISYESNGAVGWSSVYDCDFPDHTNFIDTNNKTWVSAIEHRICITKIMI